MKISFNKYPVDIILCMLCSLILLPIALLDVPGILRIVLGLPFILFIPGYILIFALFPAKKTDRGIDFIERIALSFGLSIAIVPLIGLGLNYTPYGIRLEPVFLSIFIYILGVGIIAIYRWIKTTPDRRFTIHFDVFLPKSESKIDKALTIILVASIVIALGSLIYVIVTPKTGEKFTEFYLLGPDGNATGYPGNLSVGENGTVIVGIANHEYKTMNYTIEIWLINQTIVYNESANENKTIYNSMWFLDKISTSLEHIKINTEEDWNAQWEQNYTFNINKKGNFKLAFLLFTTSTGNYNLDKDYKDIAEQKINSAYRKLHLWINVA